MKSSNDVYTFIFSDPLGKLLCIVVACCLWYFVNVLSVEKIYVSIPVDVINIPSNTVINDTNNLAVRVEFSTHEDISRRIENIKAEIDLSSYKIGTSAYQVNLLNIPNDISRRVVPEQIRVSVFPITNKIVPVDLLFTQTNKLLTNIAYYPTSISITGSLELLESISKIDTIPLSVGMVIDSTLNTNLALQIPRGVLSGANSVHVDLAFQIQNHTNQISVPMSIMGLSSNYNRPILTNILLDIIADHTNVLELTTNSLVVIDASQVTNIGTNILPIEIYAPTNTKIITTMSNVMIDIELTTNDTNAMTNSGDSSNTNIIPTMTSNEMNTMVTDFNYLAEPSDVVSNK